MYEYTYLKDKKNHNRINIIASISLKHIIICLLIIQYHGVQYL